MSIKSFLNQRVSPLSATAIIVAVLMIATVMIFGSYQSYREAKDGLAEAEAALAEKEVELEEADAPVAPATTTPDEVDTGTTTVEMKG